MCFCYRVETETHFCYIWSGWLPLEVLTKKQETGFCRTVFHLHWGGKTDQWPRNEFRNTSITRGNESIQPFVEIGWNSKCWDWIEDDDPQRLKWLKSQKHFAVFYLFTSTQQSLFTSFIATVLWPFNGICRECRVIWNLPGMPSYLIE